MLTPDILSVKLSTQKKLRRLFMTSTIAKTLQKCQNFDLKYVFLGGEEPLRYSELIEIFGNKEFLTSTALPNCLSGPAYPIFEKMRQKRLSCD